MNRSILLFSTLGLLTVLSGCFTDWNDCYQGNGIRGSEERAIDRFTSIESNSSIDIELIWDSISRVVVSGDDNLISIVETRVVGSKLIVDYLDRADCIKTNQRMTVEVHFTDLEELRIDGSGDVYGKDTVFSKDLRVDIDGSGNVELEAVTDDLLIDIDGSGDVMIEGFGEEGHVIINGSGNVDLSDFEVDQMGIEIDGSGDVRAFVNDELRVWMDGSGDVTYEGDARLIMEQDEGSGEVRKI